MNDLVAAGILPVGHFRLSFDPLTAGGDLFVVRKPQLSPCGVVI